MGDVREHAGKRQIGKGFIGWLTDAEYRQSRVDPNVRQQMGALDDHRYVSNLHHMTCLRFTFTYSNSMERDPKFRNGSRVPGHSPFEPEIVNFVENVFSILHTKLCASSLLVLSC